MSLPPPPGWPRISSALFYDDAAGAIEDHVADDFRRRRVRYVMTDREGHVVVRLAAEQVDAPQLQVRALACDDDMDFLPHELAASIDHIEAQLRIRAERDANLAEMRIGSTLRLQDHPGDVGAIAEIHAIIRQFAESGAGVILISSYLPEILDLSDRILVAKSGTIAAEFPRAEASAARILQAAIH